MNLIKIIIIISVLILPGCTKYKCLSDTNCKKVVDWNNPGFSLFRTVITNGANAGK